MGTNSSGSTGGGGSGGRARAGRVTPSGRPDARPSPAIVRDGAIDVRDLARSIPAGTTNSSTPSARASDGFAYTVPMPNGPPIEVHGHGPDARAPQGSASARGHTVRIKRGNRHLTVDGRWVRDSPTTKPATHIPLVDRRGGSGSP